MIISINLLPYREAYLEGKIRRFYILLATAFILGVLALLVAYQVFSMYHDRQEKRNEYLHFNIDILDQKLKNVVSLREKRKNLLERKQLVEGLQQRRSEQSRVFDALTRQTPDGIYLKSLKQVSTNPTALELIGYALSQTLVTKYMRTLNEAEIFNNPTLISIEDINATGRLVKEFKLTVPVEPHVEKSNDDLPKASVSPSVEGTTP
jgi:type IV pilus assembly protein PilN